MNIILANPKIVNGIKTVRDIILNKTGIKLPVVTSNLTVKSDDKVLIRWSNSLPVKGKDTVFNSPEFIQTAGNKLKCSEFLIKNLIDTIEFYTHQPQLDDFPIVIRKTLNGKGGEGIIVVENMEDFEKNFKNDVWTHYLFFSSEYRIHVMGGTIYRVFKKVLREGEEKDKYPIRNLGKYDFSLRSNIEAFPTFVDLVNKLYPVTKNIGGNFYALDIGMVKENHSPTIIEINTGPGLSENTAQYYADYFIKELL